MLNVPNALLGLNHIPQFKVLAWVSEDECQDIIDGLVDITIRTPTSSPDIHVNVDPDETLPTFPKVPLATVPTLPDLPTMPDLPSMPHPP